MLPLILTLTLALDGGIDGGVTDAGLPDAGIHDAGMRDAGAIDSGVPDAGAPWSWIDGDGGWILDGGVTDVLFVKVGSVAHVKFPFPIVLMQCDEELLGLAATEDTLLLTGVKPGHTSCGFWFWERAWPHRYVDVTVVR